MGELIRHLEKESYSIYHRAWLFPCSILIPYLMLPWFAVAHGPIQERLTLVTALEGCTCAARLDTHLAEMRRYFLTANNTEY